MEERPIPLRAHNVLCLHGFRGEGYSDAFVARMRQVHEQLMDSPSREVTLLTAPDTLCEACPHLKGGGCTLGGPGHEAHMHAQDVEVLSRLGAKAGETLAWWAVRRLVRASVRGTDLPEICTSCPWLSFGWCAAGIDAFAEGAAGGRAPGS